MAQAFLDHGPQPAEHRVAGEVQHGGMEGAVRGREGAVLGPVGRLDHRRRDGPQRGARIVIWRCEKADLPPGRPCLARCCTLPCATRA